MSSSKLYTIDHVWQSGRDLKIKSNGEPVYWVVFHTMRIGNTCTLSIHERRLNGPVLCAGVLEKLTGFTYKTAGQCGAPKHHLHRREGTSIWDQEYQFKPSDGRGMLAWKPGQPKLPGDNAQSLAGQWDWRLIVVNEMEGTRDETPAPEKVLALYSAPKGVTQQARIYFAEDLGTKVEVGALAVILGIVRWGFTRPGKLLASAFSTGPTFIG